MTPPCKEVLGGFSAPGGHGYVYTSGQQIYDENSLPLIFRGLNEVALVPEDTWAEPYPGVYQAFQDWGFNSVRLAFPWSNVEPTIPSVVGGKLVHHWDEDFVATLNRVVQHYVDHGIYVILSPMQQHFWAHLPWAGQNGQSRGQGFPHWMYPLASTTTIDHARCQFWQNAPVQAGVPGTYWGNIREYYEYIIGMFAGNKKVCAVDIFNEPYAYTCSPVQQNLDGFYQTMGTAIRSVNADIILICADSQYSASRAFSMTKKPPFNNVVYSHHLYSRSWDVSIGGAPKGMDVQAAYDARAALYNIPLWQGEFVGFKYVNESDPAQLDSLHKMMVAYGTQLPLRSWSYYAYKGSPGGLTNSSGQLINSEAQEVLDELGALAVAPPIEDPLFRLIDDAQADHLRWPGGLFRLPDGRWLTVWERNTGAAGTTTGMKVFASESDTTDPMGTWSEPFELSNPGIAAVDPWICQIGSEIFAGWQGGPDVGTPGFSYVKRLAFEDWTSPALLFNESADSNFILEGTVNTIRGTTWMQYNRKPLSQTEWLWTVTVRTITSNGSGVLSVSAPTDLVVQPNGPGKGYDGGQTRGTIANTGTTNGLIIAWSKDEGGGLDTTLPRDIWAIRSTNNGASWGSPYKIAEQSGKDLVNPYIILRSDGKVRVYFTISPATASLGYVESSDGGLTFGSIVSQTPPSSSLVQSVRIIVKEYATVLYALSNASAQTKIGIWKPT